MILHQTKRTILYVLGWVSILIGFIGAFLPILPTTPFLILGAYLFSISSPRMHKWLTSLPHVGSAIIDWEENRVIRPRAKRYAVSILSLVIGSTLVLVKVELWIKGIILFIGIAVASFILTRKSHA